MPRFLIIAILRCLTVSNAGAQQLDPSLYSGLRWRMIGPFRAGRVNAVSGVVGQPDTFYFGSVGGGVVEVVELRAHLDSDVRLKQRRLNRRDRGGAIESERRSTSAPAKRTCAIRLPSATACTNPQTRAKTWKHIGLENTKQIGRIIVDPKNPNTVFVAALGNVYAPNPDRGVYRSRDGGATWQKVLFKNDDVGAIDLAFDPTDSQIVYATLWNVRRPPWFIYAPANGPGAGIFKSVDGGSTWKEISEGIPLEGRGHIGIAVAPANRNRIYAVVDAKEGGVFSFERCRRDLDQALERQASLGPRLVFRESHCRSKECRHRLRDEYVDVSIDGRRQDMDGDQRRAGRRRLSSTLDQSRTIRNE